MSKFPLSLPYPILPHLMALSHKQRTQQTTTQRQEQWFRLEHKQQLAAGRLVERSLVDFEEEVLKEMEENPALEAREEWEEDYGNTEETDDTPEFRESDDIGRDADYDEGRADFPNDDDGLDISDNRIGENNYTDFSPYDTLIPETDTFYDSLEAQLINFELTEEEHEVMCYLIGSLDNNGYLLKDLQIISDELFVYFHKDVSVSKLEHLLKQLQTLEPYGVGARNEQECLLLQLQEKNLEPNLKLAALQIVTTHYDLFIHKRWTELQENLSITDADLEAVIQVLKHLNLKPGAGFNEGISSTAPTIIPDFFVTVNNDGTISIELNNGNVPELCISPSYVEMVRQLSPKKEELTKSQMDEFLLVQDKITAAKNFINIVNMRIVALRKLGRVIVQKQSAFFLNNDDETLLVPLKMSDIAKALDIHVSNVSRFIRNKYLRTVFGTYPVKFFCPSSFVSTKGELQSSILIRSKLEELVANEDKSKPLSDEQIATTMTELGYPLARRTVAKYREALGIPEKRLRKKDSKK